MPKSAGMDGQMWCFWVFYMEFLGYSGSLGYGGLHMQHLGHAPVAISNREAEFQEIVPYFVKVF